MRSVRMEASAMVTSSGRCHGPGCTQTAVVEFWCSERCQQVWTEQFQHPLPKRTGIPIYDDIMRAYEHLQEQRRPVYAHPDDAERVRRASGGFPWLLDVRVSDIVPRGKVILVNEPVGEFEAFDEPPTFGPLPRAVDGDSEERVCEPSPDPARGRCYCGQIPDGGGGHSPGIPGCSPELTCGCSDLSRGWLSRLLDRLFGRTT